MQHADNLIYTLVLLRCEIIVTYLHYCLLSYVYIITVLCSIFGIRRDGGTEMDMYNKLDYSGWIESIHCCGLRFVSSLTIVVRCSSVIVLRGQLLRRHNNVINIILYNKNDCATTQMNRTVIISCAD